MLQALSQKRPPGLVTNPMFKGRSNMETIETLNCLPSQILYGDRKTARDHLADARAQLLLRLLLQVAHTTIALHRADSNHLKS